LPGNPVPTTRITGTNYDEPADRFLITGSLCGVKVQEVENPLMQKIRQLDKLIDELAKGKALEKIKRSGA
ncbi:DUF2200 family protein, partial [Corynebacterium striatum]|uniref:DUF2200 family protein n=1 Tax=Corynebacterium striatum TaxID=43770 RepID=UPI000665D2B2